jgi:hypothetical protein
MTDRLRLFTANRVLQLVLAVVALAAMPPAFADDVPSNETTGDPADNSFWSSKSFWFSRFRILEMEQVLRFNYMDRGPGQVTDRGMQYRVRARLQIDLMGEGTTYLRIRAETGRGFDNSWDNTGLGKGQGQWNFNVKSFALGQKLGSHIELQAGGIEWDQGAGSQRAYASGDGHLVGYRMLVTPTAQPWLPDRFSLTMGYAGDFAQPSVFSRFHMGRLNYVQALAQKKLGTHVEGSAEVDSIRGIWFARQAVHWEKLENPLLDEVMVEVVTRATDSPTVGGSVMVSRPLDPAERWRAFAIYNQVPKGLYDQGGQPVLLNQGEMDLGKRLAWGGSYAVNNDFSLGVFGGRLLDDTPSKRWIAQFFVRYDYAHVLNSLLRRAAQ